MGLTDRERRVLLGLGGVYALVNTFIGVHSGGDLVYELSLSERLVHGLPLYQGFDTARGLPWPPFATFALIPFALLARLSLPLSKALWAISNVALFGWCLVRAHDHTRRWIPVVLAVAAVAQPLQSNFQHLNINLVLLGLVVLAIGELERGREVRAALWIAAATALKGYPGAMFLYFLARGRWRPLAAGLAAAAGLTLLAVVPAGAGGPAILADYGHLALSGASTRALAGQPIGGLVARLGGNVSVAVALDLSAAAAVAASLWRRRDSLEPVPDLGMTAVLAVLLSPLDRLHYYVLTFPAWADLFSRPAPSRGRALWFGGLALGALCTSGMLSFVQSPLPDVLRVVRQNAYILGALVLLIVLVAQRATRSPLHRTPQPT